jgi:hypothetical protein
MVQKEKPRNKIAESDGRIHDSILKMEMICSSETLE